MASPWLISHGNYISRPFVLRDIRQLENKTQICRIDAVDTRERLWLYLYEAKTRIADRQFGHGWLQYRRVAAFRTTEDTLLDQGHAILREINRED